MNSYNQFFSCVFFTFHTGHGNSANHYNRLCGWYRAIFESENVASRDSQFEKFRHQRFSAWCQGRLCKITILNYTQCLLLRLLAKFDLLLILIVFWFVYCLFIFFFLLLYIRLSIQYPNSWRQCGKAKASKLLPFPRIELKI